ncbi:MAG: helix-turn-helix transcriptional regulator [Methylocystaceae bacterium]
MKTNAIENRLREYRLRSGLTQEDLAGRVKVARQTINLIEAGKYNPSLRLCLALSWQLQATLNDIFWMEEETDV